MVTTLSIVLLTTIVCHVIGNPIKDEIKTPAGVTLNGYNINHMSVHAKRSVNSTDEFNKSLNYIDRTVKEVEAILNANASLPRLTRGEILEIIENITKTDLAAAQKQKNNERTQKAVMLVMPFTPNNDDDSKMQELYTKPPVTKIVDSSNSGITNVKPTRKPEGIFRGEVFLESLDQSTGNKTDASQTVTNVKEAPFVGTSTAEVRPDSYVQFKPLPDIGQPSEEMEEFLGRFGLGKSSKNNRKYRQYVQDPKNILNEAPEVEFEMLPDSLKDTIKEMGFTNRDGKKVSKEETLNVLNKPNDKLSKSKKQHVFNPMQTNYATQDDIDKLNQLMDIIKQLEYLNSTKDEDLNGFNIDHINELVSSLNKTNFGTLDKQMGGPNPLHFDKGLTKNEIKRQENSTNSTAAPTSAPETTPATTSTESETSNIRDLEDSFGGSANAEPEVTVTVPPPTEAPKTGFYYLLDWNTFLDIDDQKGKRVNLRFQPKAGNPQEFIAVSVP
ncbi:hypothetical protein RN001_003382 [Aquatica leii]|uniref:Uncharacterized protein n=1 Tax=Aquatica leii TaxID=1421715 RepID=A0AAN7PNL4_9COLE|nr:hypothetical protein RN001_003382 [Aquatica leii]